MRTQPEYIVLAADLEPGHRIYGETASPVLSAAPIRTLDALYGWLVHAAPGDRVSYFRGYLPLDRGAVSRLGEEAGLELDRVASAVLAMAEAGNMHLIQRRHGPGDYSYLAVMGRAGSRRRSRRLAPEGAS